MVSYAYNPSTRETLVDTECCELEASLSYRVRCCFKRIKFRATNTQGSGFKLRHKSTKKASKLCCQWEQKDKAIDKAGQHQQRGCFLLDERANIPDDKRSNNGTESSHPSLTATSPAPDTGSLRMQEEQTG